MLWLKAFHIIAVVTWFVGRLFSTRPLAILAKTGTLAAKQVRYRFIRYAHGRPSMAAKTALSTTGGTHALV